MRSWLYKEAGSKHVFLKWEGDLSNFWSENFITARSGSRF